MMCINIKDLEIEKSFWERWAPNKNDDPSNKISKVLDMKPISTREHVWNFGNMVPILTRNHEMEFW